MSATPVPPVLPQLLLSRELGYEAMRTRRRSGDVDQVRRGAYTPTLADRTGWAAAEARALAHVAAVHAQLRCEFAFSHQTAALMHGCWVGPLDGRTHITQPTRPDDNEVQGFRRHVAELAQGDLDRVGPVWVTTLERTIEDCARTMDPRDALTVADSGLRILARPNRFDRPASDVRLENVRTCFRAALATKSGWRGIKQARAVIAAADGFAESAGESRRRWAALSRGLPSPVCQLEVATDLGVFFVDFGWRLSSADGGRTWVLGEEYDGRDKYVALQGQQPGTPLYEEKRRGDALRAQSVLLEPRVSDDLRDPDLRDPDRLFRRMRDRFPLSVRSSLRPVPGLLPRPAPARATSAEWARDRASAPRNLDLTP